MARSIFLLLLATIFSLCISAQSGRKATPTPKPTPDNSTPVEPTFSESKQNPIRRTLYTDRFPKIGDGKVNSNPNATTAIAVADEDFVKVETDLITIPISVFDRNGLYIPGLNKDNFKIFEDGKEQEIAYFGTSDKPFTVILLIDTSISFEDVIDDVRNAAIAFVDQLKPNDLVMVIDFDGDVDVLTEATSDRQKIYKAIKKAGIGSGTSLYDAVDFSIKKRISKIEGRKAIVLFTDGVDTTSLRSTYDTTIDLAEEADCLIFPIYYNTFFQQPVNRGGIGFPGGTNRSAAGQSQAEYAVGKKYLEELATYTGGRVFSPEATPGGLTRAFEGIAEELRRQYNIGYVPNDEGKQGQRKQIRVRVDRPNLVVRARDSYIVGATSSKPAPKPTK